MGENSDYYSLIGEDLAFLKNTTISYNGSIYDYSDSCLECLDQPCNFYTIQTFEKVFLPLFYTLIFILGLCGNGMVLAVLSRAKESLPGTDMFILNLAIADILLVLTLPFWIFQATHSWVFGSVVCKMVGGIFKINFYASILFLVCISFDRYLSIVHFTRMYNKNNSSLILLSSLAVWVLCFLFTVPDFIFLTAEFNSRENVTSCSLTFDPISAKRWKIGLRIFDQLAAFLLPLVVMAYCYISVIVTLLRTKGFQKHKALRVILAVVAVFFLCWTPYHLVQFVRTLIYLKVLQQECDSNVDIADTITTSLGFFHCCLNPLLYAFIGIKFRIRFFRLLKDGGCVSHKFLKRHARLASYGKDSTWSESTEASYSGL